MKKADYSNKSLNELVDGYFQGSFKSMVSFFVKKNEISLKDMEDIMNEINKEELWSTTSSKSSARRFYSY